ncbi:MAG: hypothetical protein Q9219_006150 [cf. Caloplaca sp. 3 TL-2023]
MGGAAKFEGLLGLLVAPADIGRSEGDPPRLGVRDARDDCLESSKEVRGRGDLGLGLLVDIGALAGTLGKENDRSDVGVELSTAAVLVAGPPAPARAPDAAPQDLVRGDAVELWLETLYYADWKFEKAALELHDGRLTAAHQVQVTTDRLG